MTGAAFKLTRELFRLEQRRCIRSNLRALTLQSGMLPCRFSGLTTRLLVSRISSASLTTRRVSRGWITPSMKPAPTSRHQNQMQKCCTRRGVCKKHKRK